MNNKNRLVVLTGLSGSGKSTLAFDTLQSMDFIQSSDWIIELLQKG